MGQTYGVINAANNGSGEDLKEFGVRIDIVAAQYNINDGEVIRMKSLYEVGSMERNEEQHQITKDIINLGLSLEKRSQNIGVFRIIGLKLGTDRTYVLRNT